MTPQEREVMQMALDAMLNFPDDISDDMLESIKALRAALATEQEPVEADNDKVICPSCCHQFRAIPVNVQQLMIDVGFEPPFTAPPQREFIGLTDEEIDEAHETTMSFYGFARAIEAKLREKNDS
jgi:hypothetical protein